MTKFLARLSLLVAGVAVLYLSVANLALNLPAVRARIDALQPDHFSIDWQYAFSPYPLRVHLHGIAMDGQTATEQWQLDASRVAVSLALRPLLRGEIDVADLELDDLDLRLRPRPVAGAEPDPLAAFYPVIRNRDPHALAEPVPDAAPTALQLAIEHVRLRGEHRFWVSHLRGTLPGTVRGGFRMDTRVGRLSLTDGALDLALRSLQVADQTPVADAASLQGQVDIPPFLLSNTEGLQFMRVGDLDLRIDLPVQGLGFLSLIVPPLAALDLRGRGRLTGHLAMSRGEVLPGTDLLVEAHALALRLGPYDFSGDGSVEFVVDPDDEAQADLTVRFDQVQAEIERGAGAPGDSGRQRLFSGRGLTARLHAAETDPTTTSTATRAADLASEVELSLLLTIPSMQVDDLRVYNRLFAPDWGLTLLGGTGTVSGRFEVTPRQLTLDLDLASDDAGLRHGDYRANTDLLLQLRARVDDADGITLHLDGTRLQLDDARVAATATASTDAEPWAASLRIDQGALRLPAARDNAADPIPAIASALAERGFGALLASASGRLGASLKVSGLDWIAALLNRPMQLGLSGSGEIDADIVLAGGLPTKGTTLRLPADALSLAVLEHRADGQGTATLALEQGGKQAQVRLDVSLADARLRRRDEAEPSIGEVRMDAALVVTDAFSETGGDAELALKVHSARVRDLRVYNAYLPVNAPFELLSGEATLVSDLRLGADRAEGELLLEADEIGIGLARERVIGDLRLELQVRDGAAKDMRFDITGSSLLLSDLRVAGAAAPTTDRRWQARLQLEDTEVVWRKPMQLDMKAGVTVQDSRPFIALLDDERGRQGWFDDMLKVENLAGHLYLSVDGDRAVLDDAMLSAPEIGVHARGRADAGGREAMLLLRWHNLSAALELAGDQHQVDAVNARARFDAYRPGSMPLPLLGAVQPVAPPVIGTGSGGADISVDRAAAPASRHAAPAHKPHHRPPPPRPPVSENPFLDQDL